MGRNTEERLAEEYQNVALASTTGSPWYFKEFTQETVVYTPNEIGHVNCRLFLTHGGLNSLQEAVYHGVPVLGLPLGGDQELNLIKAVKEGYAFKLQWKDITEESLTRALDLLLKDRK
jgi:hypothetical protein